MRHRLSSRASDRRSMWRRSGGRRRVAGGLGSARRGSVVRGSPPNRAGCAARRSAREVQGQVDETRVAARRSRRALRRPRCAAAADSCSDRHRMRTAARRRQDSASLRKSMRGRRAPRRRPAPVRERRATSRQVPPGQRHAPLRDARRARARTRRATTSTLRRARAAGRRRDRESSCVYSTRRGRRPVPRRRRGGRSPRAR